MTKKTIEQAYEELRQIIDGGSESFTHDDAVEYLKEKLKPAVYEPEQEPVFWYKPYPNGMYNGPIHNAQIGDVLRGSEEWTPLYTAPPQPKEPEQEPVPAAMKTVIEAMQQDSDYAWGWHCNIAMSFVDAGGDHYTGNQGAARFMRTLANVEPAHELPPSPPQRKPLTDKQRRTIVAKLSEADYADGDEWDSALIDEIEAAHGIKE